MTDEPITLEDARARCPEADPNDAFRERLERADQTHVVWVNQIRQVWYGEGAAIARISPREGAVGPSLQSQVVDSAIQVMIGAVVGRESPPPQGRLLATIALSNMRLQVGPRGEYWCYVELTERPKDPSNAVYGGAAIAWDSSGEVLMCAPDLRLAAVHGCARPKRRTPEVVGAVAGTTRPHSGSAGAPGGAELVPIGTDSSFLRSVEAANQNARRNIIMGRLRGILSTVLGIPADQLPGAETPLMEAGLDSLVAVDFIRHVEAELGRKLPATLIFDHPTLEALVTFILSHWNRRATWRGEERRRSRRRWTAAEREAYERSGVLPADERTPAMASEPQDLNSIISEIEGLEGQVLNDALSKERR